MQIQCRSCGKDVPSDDVNIDTVLAKCRACHAVFDFSDQVRTASTSPEKQKRDRGEIPMPKNLVVAEGPSSLAVVRRWGRGPAFFLLFFSGFWNLIVSVFVVGAISGTVNGPGGVFIWLFLTPFILIGLGTGYVALAFLLNRTTIKIEGAELTVAHGPFRWPGNHKVDARQVSQFYCTEYVAYSQNNVPQYRMKVNALTSDGSRLELIKGVENAGQALYLEQLLERHLGIKDRPIQEEFKGSHLD